jgi:hypothetical protein
MATKNRASSPTEVLDPDDHRRGPPRPPPQQVWAICVFSNGGEFVTMNHGNPPVPIPGYFRNIGVMLAIFTTVEAVTSSYMAAQQELQRINSLVLSWYSIPLTSVVGISSFNHYTSIPGQQPELMVRVYISGPVHENMVGWRGRKIYARGVLLGCLGGQSFNVLYLRWRYYFYTVCSSSIQGNVISLLSLNARVA